MLLFDPFLPLLLLKTALNCSEIFLPYLTMAVKDGFILIDFVQCEKVLTQISIEIVFLSIVLFNLVHILL